MTQISDYGYPNKEFRDFIVAFLMVVHLYSVEAKGHFLGGWFPRSPKGEETDEKGYQIGSKMCRVRL